MTMRRLLLFVFEQRVRNVDKMLAYAIGDDEFVLRSIILFGQC